MSTRPFVEVEVPRSYAPERTYAARVVLGRFLGIEPVVRETSGDRVALRPVGEKQALVVDDGLFATDSASWLRPASLPPAPHRSVRVEGALADARLVDDRLPVLFGADTERPVFERTVGGDATLRLDVFGVPFFTLTRYEEHVQRRLEDTHGRFPASASIATRAGFLNRPIANEYAEVLRSALHAVWPRLPLPRRQADVWLTHDVDWPLVTLRRPPRQVLRSAVADVVARRSPRLARRRLAGWLRLRRGDPSGDPGDTFNELMSVAERAGVRATFTFLAGGAAPLDGRYRLTDPWIRSLVQRIAQRGHELGFHASYASYDEPSRVVEEFSALRDTATSLGVEQAEWRGRQHFLRWQAPRTWRAWSEAGLDVDSSVYFAEAPGFRTGSCHAYPVFDLDRRLQLPLEELPLTFMDVSGSRYRGLDDAGTREAASALGRACRRLGGTCVLLWHNDAVMTDRALRLYRDVVDAVTGSAE